jgi:exopolysaccharide biosynthesis polyprenyl glycosylphosphotransferase
MHPSRSHNTIRFLLIIFDALALLVSLYIAYKLRFYSALAHEFPVTKGLPDWFFYQVLLYFIIPLFISIFFQNGLYKVIFVRTFDELIRVVRSVTVGMFFLVLATFFYREFSFSRLTFLLFWAAAIALLFFYRESFKILARLLMRSLFKREKILIVGKENKMIKTILKRNPHFQVYFSMSEDEEDIPKIKKTITDKSIGQVFLTHHNWSSYALLNFYDWCENQKTELKFIPDIVQLCRGEIGIDSSLGIPIFHIKPVSLSGFNFYLKRVIDVIVSTLILSFIWPLLLLTAILIKLDSKGPAIYSQKRMGYRSNIFHFFKFRTMVANADDLLEQFKGKSERKGPVFKMSNDPRITKIGKVLRRFSIDEIPQLFNVLRGDMSLVGPRPQVLWEAYAYDDWAKRRLRVLPGITGLWQISGRAALSYEEMIELDIFYIENWSLGLDMKILLGTAPAILSVRGAY